jgi:hypothetical protein
MSRQIDSGASSTSTRPWSAWVTCSRSSIITVSSETLRVSTERKSRWSWDNGPATSSSSSDANWSTTDSGDRSSAQDDDGGAALVVAHEVPIGPPVRVPEESVRIPRDRTS